MKNFTPQSNDKIRLLFKNYRRIKKRLLKLTEAKNICTFSKRKQQQLIRRLNRTSFELNKITQGSLTTGVTSILLASVPIEGVQAQKFIKEGGANPFGITMTPTQFIDFDNDGDLDFFSVNHSSGQTSFFRNTGNATKPNFMQEGGTNPFGLMTTPHQTMVFGDIDGDKDIDAFRTFDNENIEFLRNTAGTFTSEITGKPFGLEVTVQGAGFGEYGDLYLADIDNDGDLDAFIGSKSGAAGGVPPDLTFFRNTGTATNPVFAKETNPKGMPTSGSLNFADVDGDGDLDVFLNNGNDKFYRNTGTASNPNFVDEGNLLFGLPSNTNTFVDIDGDGDADAFNGTTFFRNGAITLPPVTPPGTILIPTLSQWGLIVFGMLIMNLGLFFIRIKEFLMKEK